MFTNIYRPKKIEDFVGNTNVILPFIRWLLEWNADDKKNKCALVSGLTGIGKSLLVDLILKKHDYNIINLDLNDERDKEYMTNVIKPLLKTKKTFEGQENVLVVSEIDAGGDYGFISCLTECIKETKIPIICMCNDRYDQSIKPILNYCFDIKMTKPSYQEVYRLLYNIVVTEKIRIKESELKELYEQSNGDIRFIINTLQFGMRTGKKNIQSSNIFDTTGKLLSMDDTIDSKYEAYWLANDFHPLMIQENYVNNIMGINDQVKGSNNLAYSADALSDADLFESQVNMTNWELQPYVGLSVINAASKCNKKTMIKFPQYLGRVSTMNKNKRNKMNYDEVEFFDGKVKSEATSKQKEVSKPTKKTTAKKSDKTSTAEKVSEDKKPRGRSKKTT
jgi:replication factor C subunit 1